MFRIFISCYQALVPFNYSVFVQIQHLWPPGILRGELKSTIFGWTLFMRGALNQPVYFYFAMGLVWAKLKKMSNFPK